MADPVADVLPAKVRRPLFVDGLCSRLMDTFTGGPFLAGLGLLLGASNIAFGVLAALPFLAQAAQLPTLALLLRVKDRRATVLWTAGIARVLLGALALLLWFRRDLLSPELLMAVLAVNAVLVVTATASWNWWMRDTLPADRLGAFFGHRMRATTAAALVAMLLAGWMLDALVAGDGPARTMETMGYAILFTLGAASGFAGLYALWRIPHSPPRVAAEGQRRRALQLLKRAFQRQETRSALWCLSLVSTAMSVALPFVAVFLLRAVVPDLAWAYAAVTGLAVVSQLGYMAGLRGWGHLSDRHGERGVLFLSLAVLLVMQLGWVATGWTVAPGPLLGTTAAGLGLLLWLAVLHFFSGYALGGAELGNVNLMLKSAPAQDAQAHLAAIGLGRALLAGLGTLAASVLWEWIGAGNLLAGQEVPGGWGLRGFQVLALVGALLTVAAMAAALRVKEPRRVPVAEVARTMRREVGQMSSIAGIRGVVHAISYSVEFLAGPFGDRKRRKGEAAPSEGPEAPAGPQG